MITLPANLIAEKNKIHSADPWIVLLEITLTDSTVLRFCNNTEDITYDSNDYTAISFQMGIIESNADGKLPTISLRVCNISRILTTYLDDLDGALDSTVKVTVVNAGLLSEDYTELELEFTVLGCIEDALWVEWTLGMVNPPTPSPTNAVMSVALVIYVSADSPNLNVLGLFVAVVCPGRAVTSTTQKS